jgi:hypothetical protein
MDWRYEYPQQDPSGAFDIPGALIYMAIAGIWIWGLMAAARGSRRGLVALLILNAVLVIALPLATFFIFCPPWTDCVGWPNVWLWNWVNLISGLLAVVATTIQLEQGQSAG